MNLQANLQNEFNIVIRDWTEGNQKINCPQCQPPHNPNDKPLSVTIESDRVLWLCHHCNYSGSCIEKNGTFKTPKKTTEPVPFDAKANDFLDKYFFNKVEFSIIPL